jgi:XRE family transcriptional regulator of biofilm formation
MSLAQNLAKYRKQMNYTISDLSERADVAVGYICDLENGKKENPSLEYLNRLATALETNVSELLKN